jgi:hypothetical protein
VREGTAKLLTLFHPASGQVRVNGVTSSANEVLHGGRKEELAAIVTALPEPSRCWSPETNRQAWEVWQDGLSVRPTLLADLPPLKMLLVLDNLAGHKTPEFVVWLFEHGIMPRYTPLGGSWLNRTESVQRIVQHRALDGQEPTTPQDIMDWLEAAAKGWNREPTPFVWGGKRQQRRRRARERQHPVGGSGACTHHPIPRRRRGATDSNNGYERAN